MIPQWELPVKNITSKLADKIKSFEMKVLLVRDLTSKKAILSAIELGAVIDGEAVAVHGTMVQFM